MLISKFGNGSEEFVREFTSRYGIELDEEYTSFLIKYNGGNTPNTHVGIKRCSTDMGEQAVFTHRSGLFR